MKKAPILLLLLMLAVSLSAQNYSLKIAKLKYGGGGDWYSNKTALPNLAGFCNSQLNMSISPDDEIVEVGSQELFSYAYIYMTGHGNVVFSNSEAENLRNYLLSGGFLHIDDNYGMDPFVRTAMKKVFPELDFIELPFQHPIYHQRFDFKNGLPKVHEHDGGAARGFGLIFEGRLVCFYTAECDLGDGWEDPAVHKDPEELRQLALRMGANIIQFAFEQ